MSDGDRDLPLPTSDKVDAARDAVARAVSAWVDAVTEASEDDERAGAIVLGWVVGVEWTNVQLEQSGRGGRDIIAPREQMLSTSKGLGQFVSEAY